MPHAPLPLTIPLAALLVLLAVPSAIAARAGWAGTLQRRGRLGLHTPAALASDEAFALANRVASPLVAGAAGVGLVCAALVLALPIGVTGAVVVAVLGLAGLIGQLVAALSVGDRAAMTVPRPARKPAGGSCGGACTCGGAGGAGCCGGGAARAPDTGRAASRDVARA